jgi:hypothetical protein
LGGKFAARSKKPGASHQLSLHKSMNLMATLEFVHQVRKIRGLRIPRKHSIVYHGQRARAEVEIISNLGCAVLESHNSASAVCVSPEVSIVLSSKPKKNLGSCINTLVFGNSVHEGAYAW